MFLNSLTDDILMTLNQNEIKMAPKELLSSLLEYYPQKPCALLSMDRLIVTHIYCSCYCSFFVKGRDLDYTHICFLYEAEFHIVFVGLSKALFFRLSHTLALCKLKKERDYKVLIQFCFILSCELIYIRSL